jgi:hypothetical protein
MPRKGRKLTEEQREIRMLAGKMGGYIAKKRAVGIHAPDHDKGKGGRIGGRIGARVAQEKGVGIFAPGFDHAKAGRAAGRTTQEKRVGIFTPGYLHQGIGARIAKEKGLGIFAPDFDKSKPGRIGGRKNAENKTGICGLSKEERQVAGRKGGSSNAENKTGWCAPGIAAKAGFIGGPRSVEMEVGIHDPEWVGYGLHVRWHVNRGKVNPKCHWCYEGDAT